MRVLAGPGYISGVAERWEVGPAYDDIAYQLRSLARTHAGAIAITGEHHWEAMRPYTVKTAKSGWVNPWHHGMKRTRDGFDWLTRASPLIYTWLEEICRWAIFLSELRIGTMEDLGFMHAGALEALENGLLPPLVMIDYEPVIPPRGASGACGEMGRAALAYLLGPEKPGKAIELKQDRVREDAPAIEEGDEDWVRVRKDAPIAVRPEEQLDDDDDMDVDDAPAPEEIIDPLDVWGKDVQDARTPSGEHRQPVAVAPTRFLHTLRPWGNCCSIFRIL